jgi:hypothetical protein
MANEDDEGMVELADLDLMAALDRARARHDQRLKMLEQEELPLTMPARSMLSSSAIGRSYVSQILPSELTAEEYLVRSVEADEVEADERMKLCHGCSPRGGACEGLAHEGEGPVWRDGYQWRPCRWWRVHQLDMKLHDSGYPDRLVVKGFGDYVPLTEVLGAARDDCVAYVDRFTEPERKGKGLLLVGGYGVGKTHLAVAVARELHARGYIKTSRCWDNEYLLHKLRQHNEECAQILEEAMSVDLLLLDDLNVLEATSWAARQIAMVVNHRWGRKLPLIITTNEKLDQQAPVLGRRTISRLLESMAGIEITGEDQRLK